MIYQEGHFSYQSYLPIQIKDYSFIIKETIAKSIDKLIIIKTSSKELRKLLYEVQRSEIFSLIEQK